MAMDDWKKKQPKVKKIKPIKLKMSKAKKPKMNSWEKMPMDQYMKKRGKKKQNAFGF